MKRVLLDKLAREDLGIACRFYEFQASGLGKRFAASIRKDVESPAAVHGVHSLRFGLHQKIAFTFPYGIYYVVKAETVQVVAILDLRAEPSQLRKLLASRR